jgi:hypothetical protein
MNISDKDCNYAHLRVLITRMRKAKLVFSKTLKPTTDGTHYQKVLDLDKSLLNGSDKVTQLL